MSRSRPCLRCGRRTEALRDGYCRDCRPARPNQACSVCGAPHTNYRHGVCDLHNYHSPWYRREVARASRLVFAEEPACRRCGTTERPTLEHLDGDRWNFSRQNLARLCASCNPKAMHERRRRTQNGV